MSMHHTVDTHVVFVELFYEHLFIYLRNECTWYMLSVPDLYCAKAVHTTCKIYSTAALYLYIVATKAKTPNTNSTIDGGTFILVAAPQ